MLVFNVNFFFLFFWGGGGGGEGGMVTYENKFETKVCKIKTESKIKQRRIQSITLS